VVCVGLVVAGLSGLGASRPVRPLIAPALAFLAFYSGVFALVALSFTVVAGLLAADHAVLSVRYRLTAQAAHRAATLVALVFLVSHIAAKVLTGRVGPADAIAPFLAPGRTFYVGLGTLAVDLLALVVATGVLRHRFAGAPRLWRVLHVTAYLAWPLSIVHGLLAGRRPAWWVTWSYGLCLIAVALALLARAFLVVRPIRPTPQRPRGDLSAAPVARRLPDRPGAPAVGQRQR
jgi:hypothetical protein